MVNIYGKALKSFNIIIINTFAILTPYISRSTIYLFNEFIMNCKIVIHIYHIIKKQWLVTNKKKGIENDTILIT